MRRRSTEMRRAYCKRTRDVIEWIGEIFPREVKMKKTFYSELAYIIGIISLPLGAALLLKALHVDQMTMNLCVILLAMPVASNTAAMAERYGGDYVFASACVSVSTLLSVVTVPVITWLIQQI